MSRWVPRGRRDPIVQPLRRGARIIVTVWVLTTVPLLGACLVLLVLRLPNLVGVGLASARIQVGALSAAIRDGAVLAGVGSAMHLVFLAVMFAGLSFTVARLVRRGVCRLRQESAPAWAAEKPTEHEQAEPHDVDEDDWLAGPCSCFVGDLEPGDVWVGTAPESPPVRDS